MKKLQRNYKLIDVDHYREVLNQDKLWYLTLKPFLDEYYFSYHGDAHNKTKDWMQTRAEFTHLVEELLGNDGIYIAKTGPNLDIERKPIDTVVIHHSATSQSEDFNLGHVNALCLIRTYAPVHGGGPSYDAYKLPVWSNHFYKGRQTFIVYHYLIWPDGRSDHILKDDAIGWHAGSWEVNCQSVAICFVGDFHKVAPSNAALKTAQAIIQNYPGATIEPHSAINHATVCPGLPFFGKDGWKNHLGSSK